MAAANRLLSSAHFLVQAFSPQQGGARLQHVGVDALYMPEWTAGMFSRLVCWPLWFLM